MIQVLKVDASYLESEKAKQLKEMDRQNQKFRGVRPRSSVKGRTIILVDDGIATGASIKAALKALRNEKPARLILAVPVAPPDVVAELKSEVDELICLVTPNDFRAVGQYYRDFRQTADEEVTSYLSEKYGG
jgi:putative phosphoribosyl transferase